MSWLLGMVGATIGGSIGWWLGGLASTGLAFVVSMVGSGVGLYYGRKFARAWF